MTTRITTRAARRASLALAALLSVSAAAACDPASSGSAAAIPDADPAATDGSTNGAPTAAAGVPDSIAEGLRVYHANYCGTCHRNTLAGTAGIFGPPHDGLRATAEERIRDPGYTGSATTPESYIGESIRDPGAYRVPGFEHTRFLMPAYTQLSDIELDALVRMLLWQPPPNGGR